MAVRGGVAMALAACVLAGCTGVFGEAPEPSFAQYIVRLDHDGALENATLRLPLPKGGAAWIDIGPWHEDRPRAPDQPGWRMAIQEQVGGAPILALHAVRTPMDRDFPQFIWEEEPITSWPDLAPAGASARACDADWIDTYSGSACLAWEQEIFFLADGNPEVALEIRVVALDQGDKGLAESVLTERHMYREQTLRYRGPAGGAVMAAGAAADGWYDPLL